MNNRGRQPVVVAGATGLIGRALVDRLRAGGRRVVAACRRPSGPDDIRLDLATPRATWPAWPAADVTYICIGSGGLEACERDPDATRRVNVGGVSDLARHAAVSGSRLILISTSHVFDGSHTIARAADPRAPITAYGRQKAEAEVAVLAVPGAAVLRLSKVIGRGDARVAGWKRALLAGEAIEAFDDLAVAPLSLDDAVTALIDVGDAAHPGVFQLSAACAETYLSMALAVAESLGVRRALVRGASAEAAGVPPGFRPGGVLLEQVLPRPIDVASLATVIARALE